MSSNLRPRPQPLPIPFPCPEEDLFELSCLDDTVDSPMDEYKTPLERRKKSNVLEGWFRQEDHRNFRVSAIKPRKLNEWIQRKNDDPEAPNFFSNFSSYHGSSMDLSIKRKLITDDRMVRTHSQELKKSWNPTRKRVPILAETNTMTKRDFSGSKIHDRRGSEDIEVMKRVSVEAVNYPIIEKQQPQRGRQSLNTQVSRLRRILNKSSNKH